MNYTSQNKGIRYCGSKGKCSGMIRAIQSQIPIGGTYWEPFVGAAKVIQNITNCRRFGSDIDKPIIDLLRAMKNGWNPPTTITEQEYKFWMAKRGNIFDFNRDPMMGFVGYGCSFGARYFQGYARSKKGKVNFAASARTTLLRQLPYIKDVTFRVLDYHHYEIPKEWANADVIYCDPPYDGTKPVGSSVSKPFDSKEFWEWAVAKAKHSTVLVSEYTCPIPGVEILWQKEIAAGIRSGTGGDGGAVGSGKRKIERLYAIGLKARKNIGFGF